MARLLSQNVSILNTPIIIKELILSLLFKIHDMRKIAIVFALCLFSGQLAFAQFGSFGDKLKQKAKEALERQTDKSMDKVVGKGEGKIDQKVDETLDGKPKSEKSSKDKSKSSTEENGLDGEVTSKGKTAAVFSVSSKFDFVPGEKVVAAEDFTTDAVGDYPAKWNTNSSGEIVNLGYTANKKWLQFGQRGVYYPDFVNDLPENFTLTFDMAVSNNINEMKSGLKIVFPTKQERNLKYDVDFNKVTQVGVDVHPVGSNGSSNIWVNDQAGEELLNNEIALNWKPNEINRISLWRQKTRLRVYVNETKVWDIPRAFLPNAIYSLLFATNIMEGKAFLSDLKLAYGLPDTRNKLITEGKFSTTGILFDVNSDQIKPVSAGVLKEIAAVLTENPSVKVKIIGHTDNDGSADANLKLSKRRSDAVKQILSESYGISGDRLQTDGKGATTPVDQNTTAQGKANNRRVEFIKL